MRDTIVHLILLLVLPPLLLGVIAKTKALFAGRVGPPLLQPYRDIFKLMRKGTALSGTTTWIFRAGPVATLVSVALAGALVPAGPFAAPLSFAGDFVLFAYLLGLARFFTTAAALDTGSAFEGMGAARELTFACLSEPAFFFALLVLGKESGSLSLSGMLRFPAVGMPGALVAPLVLMAIGLFIVMLAETCRIPIDDPATHLELTMIHEVMVLDHGGPLLGMILYSSAQKLLVLGSILIHLIVPVHAGRAALDWALYVVELLGLAVAIGVVESTMARLRMRRVPYLLTGALILCGSGFILLVR
jgi:formate hydrogenlyase subunit 4